MMRSRQSRSAVASPARASSTALRVSASASPSSKISAISVALLRAPGGRALGLPDRPFRNRPSELPHRPFRNRPRASRPSCFCNGSTSTHFSFTITAHPEGRFGRRIRCDYGNFRLADCSNMPACDVSKERPTEMKSGILDKLALFIVIRAGKRGPDPVLGLHRGQQPWMQSHVVVPSLVPGIHLLPAPQAG